jgi:nicotinamidase/pyrazinamidase
MVSRDFIFWEVDTQADFMLPDGKLYVPGAEKLLPNLRRLTNAAREGRVFLVSHGCVHEPNDPEFKTFPPHCVVGTPGSTFVAEALTDRSITIPNDTVSRLPENPLQYHQIILEKQTLDIFESRHAAALLERLERGAEFVVFGVATEYCVRLAAKGLLDRRRRVSLVQDAIAALKPEEGNRTIAELRSAGANLTTTDEALAGLAASDKAKRQGLKAS